MGTNKCIRFSTLDFAAMNITMQQMLLSLAGFSLGHLHMGDLSPSIWGDKVLMGADS